jgi:hypothetical protein
VQVHIVTAVARLDRDAQQGVGAEYRNPRQISSRLHGLRVDDAGRASHPVKPAAGAQLRNGDARGGRGGGA